MSEKTRLLALFKDIEPAALGTDALLELGLSDHDVEVVTGSPINPRMLGRHHPHTNVPRFALAGSILGFFVGLFLAFVTPRLYRLNVGGKPISPGAPSIVVIFEMIMLLMLIFTFLGVFFESVFPSYEKKEYVPEISDGDIAFIFDCEADKVSQFEEELMRAGANSVRAIERQQL
jgi:hypothetical protein